MPAKKKNDEPEKAKPVDIEGVIQVDVEALRAMTQNDREAVITRASKVLAKLRIDPHGDLLSLVA